MSFNLAIDIPIINNVDELKEWIGDVVIISSITISIEKYENYLKILNNLLKASYDIYECRTYPIKFKFYNNDKKTYSLELRDFYINMILWRPFVELNYIKILDEKFIFKAKTDSANIENFINDVLITTMKEYQLKNTKINYILSDILYDLRMISFDFSIILGLTFTLKTFMDAYNNIPEIKDIMESRFYDTEQPYEIEERLAKLQERELAIYQSDTTTSLSNLISTSSIKSKQFAEFTIAKGLLPSLEGVTIPKPIENNILIRGLDRPSYLYIDAVGARKSLVMNKKVMGKAGYFGKILALLSRTLSMSTEVYDCHTKHLVAYDIKSDNHLKKLNDKFYKLNEDDPDFKLLKSKHCKNLIGKRVLVRSAATCALGDKVCPFCVGGTAIINFDIADGIGAFESEEIAKEIEQRVLSAKHLLTTLSEKIIFSSSFYKFFTMTGGEINPIANENDNVDDITDYAIYINPEDIIKVEEMDDDSLFNTCIYNGRFYIKNIKNPDMEDILIENEENKEMFMTNEAVELMNKRKGLIYFSDLDDDIKLFEMVVMNKELTKPLYDIMNLLNKQKKREDEEDIDETIESISNKLVDLLVESKIGANVIAAELIINRLIRSIKDPYQRPDFSKTHLEEYSIYTVNKALANNKSPLIGLSFQNLKRQFLSDALFTERTGTSYIDPWFYTDISTENLKKYSELAKIGDF